MYVPRYFEISDKQEIHAFIEANGFVQLVSNVEGKLSCTHLPLLLNQDRTGLIGHIARQNPHHQALENQPVLVIVPGPHDYISPSWYDTPGVPTWNYQAVHISGTCTVFENPEKLAWVVDTLTAKYESSEPEPWRPHYESSLLTAIIGVEIHIDTMQCQYKLSQNRAASERARVAAQLEKRGSGKLASAMQNVNTLY